ncbi:hypothetical protein Tco_0652177 [Tanacetum coccineum]|uniref:Zinc finger, CCHC-type n=1 Tax=Tanacetum coccineum TaxID=301880 RepID=A0ABQ4WX30_9ASTR
MELNIILVGLSKEYDSFVQNYNMHSMGKTFNELHAMLKLHEETLPKKVVAPALHAIRAGKVQKNKNKKPSKAAKGVQGKGKGKKAYANAELSYAPKPKIPPPPKKDNPAKDVICHHYGEIGCGTHICNTIQGLRGSKKLNPGALSLYVGNGQRAAVVAIGNYHLYNYDNKSSDDDNDDDVEKDEEDEEEEEHLAPADPSTVPTDDPVPSS